MGTPRLRVRGASLGTILALAAAGAGLWLCGNAGAGPFSKGEKKEGENKPGRFQRPLTLADVDSQLAPLSGTKLDPFIREQVYFGEVGMDKYDAVCRNAAIAYGSLKVSQTMLADAQENLVKYAKGHVARGEAKRQVKEIKAQTQVAETAPPAGSEASAEPAAEPEWTPEEAALVIKQAKQKKGQFTKDELAYFATMSANLGVCGYALGKGVESEIQLSQQIPNLFNSAKSDFAGINMIKAPFVLQNLNTARKHLQALPAEGKKASVDLMKYAQIIKALREETKDVTPVD
jgi:hypothetical protein